MDPEICPQVVEIRMTKEILFNNLQFIIQDQFICYILRISYYVYHISQVSRNQDIRSARPGSFTKKLVQTNSDRFQVFFNIQYPKSSISLYDTLRHSCTKKIRNCTLACSSTNSARSRVCVSRVHAGSDLVNRKHHSVESTKFILLVQIYIFCSSSKSALWRHQWPIDTRVAQNTDNRSACTNSKLEQKSPEIP